MTVPLPSLFIPFAKPQSPHGVLCPAGSVVSREQNRLWTLSHVIKDVTPCTHIWMCVCTRACTHTPVSSLRHEPFSAVSVSPRTTEVLCCVLSHSALSESFLYHGLARQAPLFMGFSGKNTEVGCPALLQGICPTQGSNPHLLGLLPWQAGSLPPGKVPVPPGKPSEVLNTSRSRCLRESAFCLSVFSPGQWVSTVSPWTCK